MHSGYGYGVLGDRVGKEMVVKFVLEIDTGGRVQGLDVQAVLIFRYRRL